MLKLNKNSRNMVGALAVAAIFFIIVKCMQSEGFMGMKKDRNCETSNGVKTCSSMDGKWKSSRNAALARRGNIGTDRNVKNVNVCRKKCMKNRDCAGFVHHVDKKMCVLKNKDQISRGLEGIKKQRGSHVYVKDSRMD